jgi:ABC-type multidrug transport system ATPase subunit
MTIGCLTGLLDPTAARSPASASPRTRLKRHMGVTPETPACSTSLRHEFRLSPHVRPDESTVALRVAELFQALEPTDTSKTLAEYSTGMRKRVRSPPLSSTRLEQLDEPLETSILPASR